MIDSRFYQEPNPISVDGIIELIGGEKHRGSGSLMVRHVAPADQVDIGGLCFVHNKAAAADVKDEKGVVCLVTPELAGELGRNIAVIVTLEPKRAFGVVMKEMFPQEALEPFIHPKADIAETAIIGDGCRIEAGAVIGANVELGAGCHIKAGASLGKGCIIGSNTVIDNNASVAFAIIGESNHIGANASIGFTGFGVGHDDGNMIIPHLGRVIMGDHNHIGANSCIDRGFLDDTVIGNHVMCDNLVQIGHNCKVGDGNVICGQVGISGSVTIGPNNIFGGNAGVADHVTIGADNVFVARCGVSKSVGDGQILAGFPAVPIQEHRREVATLRRLAARKKTSG